MVRASDGKADACCGTTRVRAGRTHDRRRDGAVGLGPGRPHAAAALAGGVPSRGAPLGGDGGGVSGVTPLPTLIESRRHQLFPRLSDAEVERMRRFGAVRRYADSDDAVRGGQDRAGHVRRALGTSRGHATRRARRERARRRAGPGRRSSAEVGQLSGRPALVDAHGGRRRRGAADPAGEPARLLVAEAELGERIMRALILRRVGLIETRRRRPGADRAARIAPTSCACSGFLARNGHPAPGARSREDRDAAALVERYAPTRAELPLGGLSDGIDPRNPTRSELGACTRHVDAIDARRSCLRRRRRRRRAGGSRHRGVRRLRGALRGRDRLRAPSAARPARARGSRTISAFPPASPARRSPAAPIVQAQKFGAEMVIPAEIAGSIASAPDAARRCELQLRTARAVRTRTVVVASGARYRRPDDPESARLRGPRRLVLGLADRGELCASEEVVLVGGGNSAGQAAVFLSGYAAKVWMLVRGAGSRTACRAI